ncbi:efflux RND transporter periplasmic adaptor subunit [Pseudoalteromonas sp. McH1-42]|uniref:efflux RND transporter periplasmic adaptor subunit n=1 Tax=Pseudoalteromonas sp. McH1-42 TaxID=2917752 RepID=UPI001EF43829|nr:efflux RND transporter periplasmic adaptor subunit [Pseudoalteromonas sp. McH1-42]MCG7563419.1 efflux RND transporter periplasmic adaptor subunit [Pseudoalteromonas sp. McH1-42]
MNKRILSYAAGLLLISLKASAISSTEPGHNHDSDVSFQTELPHQQSVLLSQAQQSQINLKLMTLQAQYAQTPVYAPGELKANRYTSYMVTPRVDSVVERRHASLGQVVRPGDKLVTLFSQDMAQAQADYMIAASEWKRVERLSDASLSENQKLVARAKYKAALGTLLAMGMSHSAVNRLEAGQTQSLGTYTLSAQREGIVLEDGFVQGQRFGSGEAIMKLGDESTLWVEVRLAATQQRLINTDTPVEIEHNQRRYPAKVLRQGHTLDPLTRTRVVRLEVDNRGDTLHAGMFVSAYFLFSTAQPVIAVPESALVRDADGGWQVFVEDEQGEYVATPVKRVAPTKDGVIIEPVPLQEGTKAIQSGTRVVAQGAFFIASEMAKSGFDPHNH